MTREEGSSLPKNVDPSLEEEEEQEFDFAKLMLLLKLLQRPQYVYKMAVAILAGGKTRIASSARARRDNALTDIGRMITAYNNDTLWQIVEEEELRLLKRIETQEARAKIREARSARKTDHGSV